MVVSETVQHRASDYLFGRNHDIISTFHTIVDAFAIRALTAPFLVGSFLQFIHVKMEKKIQIGENIGKENESSIPSGSDK